MCTNGLLFSGDAIKGFFFDFGYVIGYPLPGIARRYLYLNWDGIGAMLQDHALAPRLRAGVGSAELEAFFQREIYHVFVEHEQTDAVDPQSNGLLLDRLHLVFDGAIDQLLVDQVVAHLDTMRTIQIDAQAVEMVDQLKRRGFRLALVSNMMLPGQLLKAKLQGAGVLSCFDAVIISSDVGYMKPHPEIFYRALTATGLRPDEVLFVGDSYHQDIVGASRVGLRTAWLNSRHEPRTMARDDPPDYEIERLSELIEKPLAPEMA
ncbi:MAG: HAD family hydrolase [Anaerolineae bacterium]|nr:HAD family hydrolase [Anaerolineae bacterium]